MGEKKYKGVNKSETETIINVLHNSNLLSIYTNKVDLQKQLNTLLGEPNREYRTKRSITGSVWEISLDDKSRITKLLIKANIFEL